MSALAGNSVGLVASFSCCQRLAFEHLAGVPGHMPGGRGDGAGPRRQYPPVQLIYGPPGHGPRGEDGRYQHPQLGIQA